MSLHKSVAVRCPQCGQEDVAKVWESLNVTLDPQARELLLRGKVNLFECKICGATVLIPLAFMYHDMEHQICVQYYPFEALRKPHFFDHFELDGSLGKVVSQSLPVPEYIRHQHVVFDMAELVRYVLFRERLHQYYTEDLS